MSEEIQDVKTEYLTTIQQQTEANQKIMHGALLIAQGGPDGLSSIVNNHDGGAELILVAITSLAEIIDMQMEQIRELVEVKMEYHDLLDFLDKINPGK